VSSVAPKSGEQGTLDDRDESGEQWRFDLVGQRQAVKPNASVEMGLRSGALGTSGIKVDPRGPTR
jgi:hypothetical protein